MEKRVRILKHHPDHEGTVAYWMSRDQRIADNWALLYAQSLALRYKTPLMIFFFLSPTFLNASVRQYDFMLKGLAETAESAFNYNIVFEILRGELVGRIKDFIKKHKIRILVTDFDPLRIKQEWKKNIILNTEIEIREVDAHNIIPAWVVSTKQEYAARTIRNKIYRLLPDYLEEFPPLIKHPYRYPLLQKVSYDISLNYLTYDSFPQPVNWIKPGNQAAMKQLQEFTEKKLPDYGKYRNDPNIAAQSDLSPYLHFGQISAARIALDIMKSPAGNESRAAFLEELIVMRELADNFCFYNRDYDNFKGAPLWAQATLIKHIKDKRTHLYSLTSLENADTHDPLWNAAQLEMILKGKMPGYLRMYWAKKILEWTPDPDTAIEYSLYLNDKYELDGRDPNGYTGIMWSIAGVHDRPWFEREVFGKIRYMSYNGCARKFKVQKYITHVQKLLR